MNNFKWVFFFLFILIGCNLPNVDDLSLNGEYAIPLINDVVTFQDLFSNSEAFSVLATSDGQLVLRYESELLSESIQDLLPSIPSIGEVPITDTLSYFPLSTSDNFVITRAILSGDQMRFRYSYDQDEDLTINMQIPELTKDGKIFEFDYELKSTGELPFTEFTQQFDLSGYEFQSVENLLTFRYDARNEEGERVKLSFAAMSFNLLKFKYGEGSFERTIYDLDGDSISVNVFNGWQSGKVEFKDPKLNFKVTHSYGFPVSIKINEISFVTIENERKILSGSTVGEEIPLSFPSLSMVGDSSTTALDFDKMNSNIHNLFNEKIKYIDYDVDAIVNPSGNLETTGFVTENSAFTLDINLDIPLAQKITNLFFSDTLTLENIVPDNFSQAEFKVITENTYPVNISLALIFLDENNQELERLFGNQPLIIEPSLEKTRFLSLDASKISKLKQAHKIVIQPIFDTSAISSDFVEFSQNQFLELRVGLKFKL